MSNEFIMNEFLKNAKQASIEAAKLTTIKKNKLLNAMADSLIANTREIINENLKDLESAEINKLSGAMIDRLLLNENRIINMANAIREIVELPDPVGNIEGIRKRPNGIEVGQMRIPLGVILMIYESRPNVTSDAATLCLKSGNAIILRGGKEAINSNLIIAKVLREVLIKEDVNPNIISLVPNTDRTIMNELLVKDEYIDLVIPRGGEGLIKFVKYNSKVPVIMHYKGVCHIYIDKDADMEIAKQLTCEGKLSRPGVCNSLETILIHKDIAKEFLSETGKILLNEGAEIRGCKKSVSLLDEINLADESDYYEEYLDKIITCKIVDDIDEAVNHIEKYNSDHTEVIVTKNINTAKKFQREINSSVVCVNVSSRFSDGGELGLGAEIGISTSKLHAYGPMGIESLTTKKFVVSGEGQLRHEKIY